MGKKLRLAQWFTKCLFSGTIVVIKNGPSNGHVTTNHFRSFCINVSIIFQLPTVVNMHVLSLTAPQHPKKAVMKTTAPIIIDKIGANPNSDGNILDASLMLNLIKIPIITNAKPANCNKENQNKYNTLSNRVLIQSLQNWI